MNKMSSEKLGRKELRKRIKELKRATSGETEKKYKQGEPFWEPMKKYGLDEEDNTNVLEESVEDEIKKLKKMKPNVYLVFMTLPARETNTQPFFDYIERLKDYGLDIDKIDTAEYGFKMPLAEKGEIRRELVIFRRKERKEKIFRRK